VNRFGLVAFVALISLADARAALWQTRAQVNATYGQPVRRCEDPPGYVFWLYRFRRMDVLVTFVRGRSHREVFYRARTESLTKGEVRFLLRANSAGHSWRQSRNQEWSLGKSSLALAQQDTDDNSMVFYTSDYLKRPSVMSGRAEPTH
jgi:hypothetical protein